MAKAKRNTEIPAYLQTWKAEVILVVVFLAVSYGFVSWAINSGSLVEYTLGILFLGSAIKTVFMAARTFRNS